MSAVATVSEHALEAAIAGAQLHGRGPNIARWLDFAGHTQDDVVELQALHVKFGSGDRTSVERTYVAHAESRESLSRLLDEGEKFDCPGLYWIANRVDAAVATRLGAGKWRAAAKGASTTDRDIVARTVLFVDVDAERPTGTSSTASEMAASVDVATRIHGWFEDALDDTRALGYAHSGNGRQVYLALDSLTERDAGPLVKACLVGLDFLFSNADAKVDTAVSEPKRLVPAFGTQKRKGAPGIAARPHRTTAFICHDDVRRLGIDELRALVARLRARLDPTSQAALDKAMGIRQTTKPAVSSSSAPIESPFARANEVPIGDVLAWTGLGDLVRPNCPGCSESDSGVAVVGNGLKCSHARCASKGYRDGFRTPVDVVAEVRGVDPREAVSLMAEQFGFEGFASKAPLAPTATATLAPISKEPLSPTARVQALARLGAVVRLPSGIETFDASCRGGVPTRRLVVLGGAPGAGKTTLATNLLWRWAKAGIPVAMLAVDEDADGILMRIAQLEGLGAERVEERDHITLEKLSAAVEATELLLVDGDEPAGTVEGVASLLAARAAGRDAVLIVDSVQTARAFGADGAASPRERIDTVMRALKAARDKYGFLVVATCELARGSYRSKNTADQINDLAAFKESGGIEYAAQTALVLRSVPDEPALIDVAVPKNRAYRRNPFRLRLDHATTLLTEVEMPAQPEGSRANRAAPVDKDADVLRRLLVARAGINGMRAVRDALRAQGSAMSNDRVGAAVEFLRQRGELENRGGERRPAWWLRAVTSGVEADD